MTARRTRRRRAAGTGRRSPGRQPRANQAAHRLDDTCELLRSVMPGKIGSERHSRPIASATGNAPSPVAEDGVGPAQMRRLRIVAAALRSRAPRGASPSPSGSSVRTTNTCQTCSLPRRRPAAARDHRRPRAPRGRRAAIARRSVVPAVEQRELPEQHGRLNRVEPGGPADLVVVVLPVLAVLPKRSDASRRAPRRR